MKDAESEARTREVQAAVVEWAKHQDFAALTLVLDGLWEELTPYEQEAWRQIVKTVEEKSCGK